MVKRAMSYNNFFKKFIVLFSIALLVSLFNTRTGMAQGPVKEPPLPEFAPGEIIVKFRPDASPLVRQNSLRATGLSLLEASPQGDVLRLQVKPGQEATAMADLLARGQVEYASPNYYVYATGDPNDPYYSAQWGLKQAQDHDIDAPEAWNIHTGTSNVIIAVIDTGVDLDHPDLVAKITSGGQAGYNYISPGALPDDDNGHGTHVAGIAAASGNNGVGIAGVSWGARVMPLKVLSASGSGTIYNLALAIRYAADHGAKVINMSLGGGCGTGWPDVESAVNYAVSKGVVLVAASGNNYAGVVSCPGAINGVMAVGATDSSDVRASYSNYGTALDVMAPGSSIYSTWPGGGYAYDSGTSMATPHVAGLAALLWSFAPGLNNYQIQSLIQNNADDLGIIGWDQEYGYGRINAYRTLLAASLQVTPAPLFLFVDANTASTSRNLLISTTSAETIAWNATIPPEAAGWLSITSAASGSITASTANQLTLTAARPGSYGTYTTHVSVTGTTALGIPFGPIVTRVTLYYVPQIYTYHFPLIFKN